MKQLKAFIGMLVILLLVSAYGLTSAAVKQEGSAGTMATIDDLATKRIGVPLGSVYDNFAVQRFPQATILHYNSTSDIILALKNGKIDGSLENMDMAKTVINENPELAVLADDVLVTPIGIGFNKNNSALRERFNHFLAKTKSDGSFAALYKKWYESDLATVQLTPFPSHPDGEKVIFAIAIATLPVTGYINGEYAGFEVELVKTFAHQEKLNLTITSMDFSALIPALAAGKADMIAATISITEERKKQIDFSDSYQEDRVGMMVLKKNLSNAAQKEAAKEATFWGNVREGFYNNIMKENRYLLIADGLKTTVVISLFSVLFGTVLGGGICWLRMSRRRALNLFARFYISLIRGIPVLVLLMLMYYVVFATVSIDPVLVAVIAFGINFAAYVSEMFRTAIESVDKGQREAGIAAGFSPIQTFIYIILPQALKQVLPVYKGELISLVKMTSIVGYVAVQDLTKASDIIRSRTFDAFFPLIMTAVLYFAIAWVLLLVLEAVERQTDPRYRRHQAQITSGAPERSSAR